MQATALVFFVFFFPYVCKVLVLFKIVCWFGRGNLGWTQTQRGRRTSWEQNKKIKKRGRKKSGAMKYRWALISLGSKVTEASEASLSSAPFPLFLSLFSPLRYIFIICFSCSDWMVTWHPNMGLVVSTFWLKSEENSGKKQTQRIEMHYSA